MTSPVVHWQFLTADPDRTASFYEQMFGWSVSTANAMGYRSVASCAGRGIDGGIWPAPPGAPESVQLYVEVEDIDAALARVQALGGTLIMPKQVLPDGDAMALALDPLGRSFGLTTPRRAAQG
jgi:uncharacterized protein